MSLRVSEIGTHWGAVGDVDAHTALPKHYEHMLASAGHSDARPPALKLKTDYNPAEFARLSKQISPAQLRAMAAQGSTANKATHPSERGLVRNLFSATTDRTVASWFLRHHGRIAAGHGFAQLGRHRGRGANSQ